MRIAIIGGGASGLMAAAAAKTETNDVLILERCDRVGRKLLATGNGRCNLTNRFASLVYYHGEDVSFALAAMEKFNVNDTVDFFGKLGILCKEEEKGKIYPYSDSASSVLDVLRRRVDRLGIETICGFDVKTARKTYRGFEITSYDGKKVTADKLIVAAGGKASPSLGSNGSGYKLLEGFGHSITQLSPSLVQIKTETEVVRRLKGIKVSGAVTVKGVKSMGEILFTDYGLSGPPAFELSAVLADKKRYGGGDGYAHIDLMPSYKKQEVRDIITNRCEELSDVPLEEFFTGMFNKRVGQALFKSSGIFPLSKTADKLTENEKNIVISNIKDWKFKIEGTMSWNNAQVTHGGAITAQFNPNTMESLLENGLYACGEILDIDGDCGGFNLQWAWASGYTAGLNAKK